MRVQSQRITCKACDTVSDVDMAVECTIEVWSAIVKATVCPACGASYESLCFGGEHKDVPSPDAPMQQRVEWWRRRGEHGISSKTIFAALYPVRSDSTYDVPHDADDLRRCLRLIEIVPEWRSRLSEVTARFPWWQPLETAWSQLEELFAIKDFEAINSALAEVGRASREIRRGELV